MRYRQLSKDCAIGIIPKVGSMSIDSALDLVNSPHLSYAGLKNYGTILVFVRDPLERLRSCFNHFYWLTYHNIEFSQILPKGVIRATGAAQTEIVQKNQHRGRILKTNEDKDKLDNNDYRNFVDYVLKNNEAHWKEQSELCKHDGLLVPNKFYKFEDITSVWGRVNNSILPHNNSWTKIKVDYSYRDSELRDKYAQDYELRSNCGN